MHLKSIQPKQNKCRGTGIAIGYGCGEPQIYRTYGLGHGCKCYQKWLVNSDAGKEKLNRSIIKVSKPRTDLEKAEKANKDRTKLIYLLNNTKTACHTFVKLRDYGKPCISCGTLWKDDFQAGHFYKAELYSTLKYDENNISGQCQGCNLFKDGNESGYRDGLINRYGQLYLSDLDKKANLGNQSQHHWDRETLIDIRKYYQKKIRELKK